MSARTGHKAEGLPWGEAALANCAWTGARLRDVLSAAGVRDPVQSELHACFTSHSQKCQEDDCYGGSVPLEKALDSDGDVLIAYEVSLESTGALQGC
jgi:sulfite oxidase